jgi:predicted small metal-binding protein
LLLTKPRLKRRKEVRTMAGKLKKLECDPKCGFVIQSHDEKEVIDIAIKHAKKAHSMDVSEKEARGMMKDA